MFDSKTRASRLAGRFASKPLILHCTIPWGPRHPPESSYTYDVNVKQNLKQNESIGQLSNDKTGNGNTRPPRTTEVNTEDNKKRQRHQAPARTAYVIQGVVK